MELDFQQELQIIETLRDDAQYFGDFGRQFISNSDINNLIKSPDKYGKPWENNADFLKGKYLHQMILLPEREEPMLIVDANTRTTTVYKEIVLEHTVEGQPKPMFLLQKEVDAMQPIIQKIEGNNYFMEMLRAHKSEDGFDVEEPAVGEIAGKMFKGKSDRINHYHKKVIDFKTTRSIDGFSEFFRKYGYHSQAYIYKELFGYEVMFFVVEKDTGRLGVFEISDETYEAGHQHVLKGLGIYDMYFGDKANLSLDQYYSYDLL